MPKRLKKTGNVASAHCCLCSAGVSYSYHIQGSLFTPVTTGVFFQKLKSIPLNGNQRFRTSSKPKNHQIMPFPGLTENRISFLFFSLFSPFLSVAVIYMTGFYLILQFIAGAWAQHEKVIKILKLYLTSALCRL